MRAQWEREGEGSKERSVEHTYLCNKVLAACPQKLVRKSGRIMRSDCYGSTAGAKAGTISSGSKFPHRDLNKLVWDRAEYKMKLFSVVLAVRGFAVFQDST